ncbi:hypothetical protein R1sor_027297 [Riccia sorocarpa]|uniref:Integrase catalytic domain-containing protein n=1 Tax=Riccia sorocarpa TaxID=122646 RepID=A0ABD3GI17_9MARC
MRTRYNCNRYGLPGHFMRDYNVDLSKLRRTTPTSRGPYPTPSFSRSEGRVLSVEDSDAQGGTHEGDSPLATADNNELEAALAALMVEDGDPSWYVDSGASTHVTGTANGLDQFTEVSSSTGVKSAGGQVHSVKGSGNVLFKVENGEIKRVSDVLYVPGLSKNLLSVGRLTDKGVVVIFDTHQCVFFTKTRPIKVIGRATRDSKSGLYRFCGTPVINTGQYPATCNAVLSVESRPSLELAHLWHKRFGHLSYSALHHLSSKQLASGLPTLPEVTTICEGCTMGKQVTESYPKQSEHRSQSKLEVIHSDICGPLPTPSLGGGRYFATFTDDFSRKTWIFILKTKGEVFQTFVNFKTLMENQTGSKIKVLRTDRGGEYLSRAFKAFCERAGIHRQLTVAYSPQQNGVSERKNRTILSRARSMALDSGLPLYLWAEVVTAATMLTNMSPTRSNSGITPDEKFFGTRPDVSRLRSYGCLVFAHIDKNKLSKLESRARRCFLVGYDLNSKAYRCFDPLTRKVLVVRNVIFDEISDSGLTTEDGAAPTSTPATTPTTCTPPVPDTAVAGSHGESADLEADSEAGSGTTAATEDFPIPVRDNTQPGENVPRRSGRSRTQPKRFGDYVMTTELEEPTTYKEASKSAVWRKAMNLEMEAIQRNNTWTLEPLPHGKKKISAKWVFKVKTDVHGLPITYKVRLVARGFEQREGFDYNETFAPVAKWNTLRTVVALAAKNDWELRHLDIKSAFLNGDLTEEVFMSQPEGFVQPGSEHLVCRLHKALYGLKQAPRAWYDRMSHFLKQLGMTKSTADNSLFVLHENQLSLIVAVYVDDLLITGSHTEKLHWLVEQLHQQFDLSSVGEMTDYLRVRFTKVPAGILMSQPDFINKILTDANMQTCNPCQTPMEAGLQLSSSPEEQAVDEHDYRSTIGQLIHLTHTRPDISYSVSILSRFMSAPKIPHLQATKRLLRYLKGTKDFGVLFSKDNDVQICGFTDADWAGCKETRRSTTGFIFMLGRSPITWSSKKQPTVACSSTKAEYRALSEGAKEAIWLQALASDLALHTNQKIKIWCDNVSSIKLAKNPVFHARTKHVEIHYHHVRELVAAGHIDVQQISSKEQTADILTKALGKSRFLELRPKLGVMSKQDLLPGYANSTVSETMA